MESPELFKLKVHLGIRDDKDDLLLLMLLKDARNIIERRLFPFGDVDPAEVDTYTDKIIDIAQYKYNYESGDLPASFLRGIVSHAGTPK